MVFVQIMAIFLCKFWASIECDGYRPIDYDHTWNHLLLGKKPTCLCSGLCSDEQLILDATFLRQLLFVRFAVFGEVFFSVTGVCFGRHMVVRMGRARLLLGGGVFGVV